MSDLVKAKTKICFKIQAAQNKASDINQKINYRKNEEETEKRHKHSTQDQLRQKEEETSRTNIDLKSEEKALDQRRQKLG